MDYMEAELYVVHNIQQMFAGEMIDPENDVAGDVLDYALEMFEELGFVLVPTNGQV